MIDVKKCEKIYKELEKSTARKFGMKVIQLLIMAGLLEREKLNLI